MRRCELCKSAARMYCESDQASLCWDCDAKVHSANFLVARHSRSLLCYVCQSQTAWSASGARLGPTVSVCESCIDGCEGVKDRRGEEGESEGEMGDEFDADDRECDDDDDGEDDDDDDSDDDDDGGSEEDDDEEDEFDGDDEDGDNQVVPWSSTPPPPAASSTSSEDSSSRLVNGKEAGSLKRLHENGADYLSEDDDLDCSSHQRNTLRLPAPASRWSSERNSDAAIESNRTLKRQRTNSNRPSPVRRGSAGSRTAVIVESLKRIYDQNVTSGGNASSTIVDLCKLSRNRGL
ncbi:hypothetical protein NMG60_11003062 [Bertholletia excelsa]